MLASLREPEPPVPGLVAGEPPLPPDEPESDPQPATNTAKETGNRKEIEARGLLPVFMSGTLCPSLVILNVPH